MSLNGDPRDERDTLAYWTQLNEDAHSYTGHELVEAADRDLRRWRAENRGKSQNSG